MLSNESSAELVTWLLHYVCCYRLTLSPTPGCPQSVCSMFSVVPVAGTVGPNDKPIPFHVSITPKRELTIKDEPILYCHVIEPRRTSVTTGSIVSVVPSMASLGDAIANIPIRVSCQSSYSKYATYCSLFMC